MPKSYKDYVFKDGFLIGEFDAMYKESEEVPWNQDKTAFSLAVDFDLTTLKKYLPTTKLDVLDIGCGMGCVTDRLRKELSISTLSGCDISEHAIKKAREKYDGIDFFYKDMLCKTSQPEKKYDFIYVKDILWYVIDDIETFTENILSLLKPEGMLYTMQSFPDLEDYYGKSIFPNPESILKFYEKYFKFRYKSIIKENYSFFDSTRVSNNYNNEFYIRFFGVRKNSEKMCKKNLS